MAMNDAVKRKEPEHASEEPEAPKTEKEVPKTEASTTEARIAAEAAKTAQASEEPEAKRLKPTPPDAGTVRKQIEYYLSDDNLRHDKFFHDKISGESDGWLEISLILSCNKMKAMRATKDDVLAALKESKIEVREDSLCVRRPGNMALPTLEARPQHQKKNSAHAHDGGVLAVIKDIPTATPEQEKDNKAVGWMQIKEKLRGKLPEKVQLWFVSEVNDKKQCFIASAPFEGDLQFFEELALEAGDVTLKVEVAHGDVLQQALKVLPKHIRDKREKEVRKRQKERNRPIVIGSQRFVTVHALRIRVKEILNARSDGEQLKVDGSDYKLIQAILSYHPKGETKSKGMVGIKVAKSSQGDSRCFWMVKDNGECEDFSAQKCLNAIESNPPYVEAEPKKGEASPAAKAVQNSAKPEEKSIGSPAEEKKEAAGEEKKEEKKEAEEQKEEKKDAAAVEKNDEAMAA